MLENVMTALRDGLSLVFTFVPKLLLFLIILPRGRNQPPSVTTQHSSSGDAPRRHTPKLNREIK
jgi:hypothetical protein